MVQLLFNDEKYLQMANSHAEEYHNATPFPHIAFDEFLPEEDCNQLLAEFPDKNGIPWINFNDPTGIKLASNNQEDFGSHIYRILQQFNSAPFLQFLEELTGISGIIPDPYFEGGGLHQIGAGGFLKIHADFNYHKQLKLDRRINVLLYLNKDWNEEYGGHLELWDDKMKNCAKKILPVFNRLAIFSTTSCSYHGHPEPLTCPERRSRKSLALYYYTNGRPDHEKNASHTTLYKHCPGEHGEIYTTSARIQRQLNKLLMGTAWVLKKPANLLEMIADRVRPPEF